MLALNSVNADEALTIVLLIIGVLAVAGAAYCAWLSRIPAAVALFIIGIVLIVLAA